MNDYTHGMQVDFSKVQICNEFENTQYLLIFTVKAQKYFCCLLKEKEISEKKNCSTLSSLPKQISLWYFEVFVLLFC